MHEQLISHQLNWPGDTPVQHTATRLLGNLLPIPVDIFQTAEKGRRPAVLFLYGATGLTRRYYPLFYYLARLGYVVFVPRFLMQPGRSSAGPQASRTNFFPWLRTLSDVLVQMTYWPSVDQHRIGLVGMSLGASLGLVLASRRSEINAFVHWIGDVPERVVTNLASMPPTMIIHGGCDRNVRVERVISLALRLKGLHVPCQLRIYPHQKHILQPIVNAEAAKATGAFLNEYV